MCADNPLRGLLLSLLIPIANFLNRLQQATYLLHPCQLHFMCALSMPGVLSVSFSYLSFSTTLRVHTFSRPSCFAWAILSVTDRQVQVLSGPRATFRPLWAQAPVALGCGLFNGATPVWEQPGAQDTGGQLSKLAILTSRAKPQ